MHTTLTNSELMSMEQRQRANLINSVGGFKSLCLIASVDHNGKTNLAVFSSVTHVGANPPLIGFIVRPDSVERHTLFNILETGQYTINHVNTQIFKQAHQTSARYAKEISEFDATGLTPQYKKNFKAPFVKQSNVQMGIEFVQRVNLEINNTILIIGKINLISFPEDCWCKDGFLDLEKAQTITCSGLDSYHTTRRLARLSYAKPDKRVEELALNYVS